MKLGDRYDEKFINQSRTLAPPFCLFKSACAYESRLCAAKTLQGLFHRAPRQAPLHALQVASSPQASPGLRYTQLFPKCPG